MVIISAVIIHSPKAFDSFTNHQSDNLIKKKILYLSSNKLLYMYVARKNKDREYTF